METTFCYATASEPELDELLLGHEVIIGSRWPGISLGSHLRAGLTGVLWKEGKRVNDPVRPLLLVARDEERRRLCGRYAQLRSDLSPLTAWCHLLTPEFFDALQDPVREADLGDFQAAWTGLVVAEAVLLADKPIASIRIPACFATQTFAIARTKALWNHVPVESILAQFDLANRLCRSDIGALKGDSRLGRLRSSLEPIWISLAEVSGVASSPLRRELEPVVASLRGLDRARSNKDKAEARSLAAPLLQFIPEAEAFDEFTALAPETRLRLFDRLIEGLEKAQSERDIVRQSGLALLAGYIATVAAGGAPSLALTEESTNRWPEVTAWAYLIGGIGEKIVWTSAFDGLGRLVSRELIRPLKIQEPPTSDFSLDEAVVLADPKLSDPLVHLRLKQSRIATVALFPGVNVQIPIAEASAQESSRPEPSRRRSETSVGNYGRQDVMAVLADAIWPFIRARVEDFVTERNIQWRDAGESNTRGRRKSASQSNLPLNSPKK